MDLKNSINHLSLSEAIEALRTHYHGLMQGDEADAQSWFLNHDATHVIFGTVPFDLKGETFNDIWTIFGSTVTFKEYLEFFNFIDSSKVFRAYGGRLKVFFVIIRLIPRCFRVFMQTRKMTKKWPWAVTEDILLKKIGDLRAEFNIKLL